MHVNANLDELAPIGPLTDWLDATIPDLGRGPLRRELQHGGTTNVILTLNRGRKDPVFLASPAPVNVKSSLVRCDGGQH